MGNGTTHVNGVVEDIDISPPPKEQYSRATGQQKEEQVNETAGAAGGLKRSDSCSALIYERERGLSLVDSVPEPGMEKAMAVAIASSNNTHEVPVVPVPEGALCQGVGLAPGFVNDFSYSIVSDDSFCVSPPESRSSSGTESSSDDDDDSNDGDGTTTDEDDVKPPPPPSRAKMPFHRRFTSLDIYRKHN